MGVFLIGAKTIALFVKFLLTAALVVGAMVAVVWVLSTLIQLGADAIGLEVGSLWGWFKSKLPEIKWRKRGKDD